MKYHETHFQDYLKQKEKYNVHEPINTSIGPFINHTIIYGPCGSGKYSESLQLIQNYSKTNLKMEKKMEYQTEKGTFFYKISDIHFEIDIDLLGCNAKQNLTDIFIQITEIVVLRPERKGIILCKNFDKIHIEIVNLFYNFLYYEKTCNIPNIELKFVILTNTISFLPYNILNICDIICLHKPNSMEYTKLLEVNTENTDRSDISDYEFTNLKELYYYKKTPNHTDNFDTITTNIIQFILNCNNKTDLCEFREILYDILTYNIDIEECFYFVLCHFIENKYLNSNRVSHIIQLLNNNMKYYNNNYRPIYHIERLFYSILINYHHEDKKGIRSIRTP
tara:strand:+ start:173 stop:1180 length:1008 start_codon:yes stop_codon:yes gene_type:complete